MLGWIQICCVTLDESLQLSRTWFLLWKLRKLGKNSLDSLQAALLPLAVCCEPRNACKITEGTAARVKHGSPARSSPAATIQQALKLESTFISIGS